VNLTVLSRPCVALRLVARGRLPPFAGRGPPGFRRLCGHRLSLTSRLGNALLSDGNQERLLRDDFAGFEALPASGRRPPTWNAYFGQRGRTIRDKDAERRLRALIDQGGAK